MRGPSAHGFSRCVVPDINSTITDPYVWRHSSEEIATDHQQYGYAQHNADDQRLT